jgi:hypothetical protein
VSQTLSEVHEAVTFVAEPVSSTNFSADALLAPLALFQLLLATTPAVSEALIGVVVLPLKLTLMAADATVIVREYALARRAAESTLPRSLAFM